MNRPILASLLALAACTKPGTPPPAVEVRVVEKIVEVPKPCPVTRPPRPAKLALPLPADAVQLAATIAAKLAEYSAPGGWADRMDTALGRCTAVTP